MPNISLAIQHLATQQYGPLYIVYDKSIREDSSIYLLDKGQRLRAVSSQSSDVPHPDLRKNQHVYGRTSSPALWWEPGAFQWNQSHPSVRDGSAKRWVEQLIQANETAMGLGIFDYWSRQLFLSTWADNHLGVPTVQLPLPDLDIGT